MFLENHSPFPYYLSAYALSSANSLIYRNELPNTPKRFRYHLLMLFRMLYEPSALPYLNDKRKMDAYCSHLFNILTDAGAAREAFQECARVLHEGLKQEHFKSREADRLRAFTNSLMEAAEERARLALAAAASLAAKSPTSIQPSPEKRLVASVERRRGTVATFSDVKGYGFITPGGGEEDIFVHYSGIKGTGFRTLREAQIVEFTVLDRPRGPIAVQVEVVDA
jgi:CspA family cold shock protein